MQSKSDSLARCFTLHKFEVFWGNNEASYQSQKITHGAENLITSRQIMSYEREEKTRAPRLLHVMNSTLFIA